MGFLNNIKNAFKSNNKNKDMKQDDSNESKQINKNFKYLDNLVKSQPEEIVLDSDIILSEGEDLEYFDGIVLNYDGLTIDGNGHTIDACGKTALFICTGQNITIKNIKLKNGITKVDGGAILNFGELTIENSILMGNTSNSSAFVNGRKHVKNSFISGNGGAIFNSYPADLTIIGSTFTDNTAKGWGGGAIHNDEGELTIIDSVFTNNVAQEGNGGAICNDGGEISITNSTFTDNISQEGNGGAIINADAGELSITSSTFTDNISQEGNGGAVYNAFGDLKQSNCIFKDNKPDNVSYNSE